jgi:hypothetical protein|tara:strand:- start:1911 stop:2738 length:828 start_codon:yes stop_codon:yes gene_type:complete
MPDALKIEYDVESLFGVEGDARILIKVWERPEAGASYALGADVAEGLEHGDDSALCVLRSDTGNQCAEFVGSIDPDEFGLLCYLVGQYYNWAYILVENNKDITPLQVLKNLDYPNMHYEWYYRADLNDGRKEKLGWNTNALTRNKLVNDARTGMRDHLYHVRSSLILDQMSVFQRNKRGKYEHIRGAKDDAIFGWMLAIQGLLYFPIMEELREAGHAPAFNARAAENIGDPSMADFVEPMLSDEDPEEDEDEDRMAKHLRLNNEEKEKTTMGGLI